MKALSNSRFATLPIAIGNALGKYKLTRSAKCIACGKCVELCPEGVHVKPAGYAHTLRPKDYLCIGPECAKTEHYCVSHCPEQAITLERNPTMDAIGDPRWTADLILSTWHMAETGHAPKNGLEFRHGESGGGFDNCGSSSPLGRSPSKPAPLIRALNSIAETTGGLRCTLICRFTAEGCHSAR